MPRVKFISRQPAFEWDRYFDDARHVWKSCEFIFDRSARDYDWLVVYDELPAANGGLSASAYEELACLARNTILITTEPCSIKSYGRFYAQQFGHVLTTQPAWALPHPRRHWQQASNHWFYGCNHAAPMSRERLLQGGSEKTKDASMVGSAKAQRHTMHWARYAFISRVQALAPEVDVYGRGYIPMPDKALALDAYRYHITLENHIAPHHWTEKLADAFIGRSLPFYAGAPNAAEYFPEGSFVPVDMKKPEEAVALLRRAIAENWYEQRRPLIEEARRRVLEEYHLFAQIEKIVAGAAVNPGLAEGKVIYSRHALRRRSPRIALYHAGEKLVSRLAAFWQQSRPATAARTP
jgi:hypothetical protein